ncbi:hypothetical protein AAFN85_10925 [Mucilaginibacter sp. CAU 1740]|uniref:hypothetical protein n=1 Tax=Mucilaginibacter sp. CAU 1740 TaxID=3140365 RepID=UPI00325A7B10
MKRIYYTIIFFAVWMSSGCQKDPYPYITLDQVKQIDSVRHPAIENVVFVYNSELYLMADFAAKPLRITNSGVPKKFVKGSHDHTKFAYLSSGNIIEIVDKTGKLITTLTNYNDVRNFDWSADDKTLYIVNGESIAFYGPALKVPSITYEGGYYEFISAAISDKGDFAYILKKYNFSALDQYEVVIKPANGGTMKIFKDDNNDFPMAYINFAANTNNMMLGFRELHSGTDDLDKVYLFEDLNDYPALKLNASSSRYSTPVYNSKVQYLLWGVDRDDKHVLFATYLKDDVPDNNKLLAGFDGVHYLDWK